MFEKAGKRNLVGLVAPASLAIGLSFGSVAAIAGSYVTSSDGDIVYNNFKECWNAATGTVKNVPYCGDVAAPAPAPSPALDSDGDGVTDDLDRCPNSLYGAVVNSAGCFVDGDGDGVADSRDRCPDTASGVAVDVEGCALPVASESLHEVLSGFAFDKADTVLIKPFDKDQLRRIAGKIKGMSGDKQVHVTGYTDSIGPEDYNLNLSERRAQTVADYLASQGVLNITVQGKGETNFVGDNDTPEGRALNRRIEIVVK
jgi:OOP family OmpA-OmpF porin